MYLAPKDLLKLALAILIGGLNGVGREYRDRPAGFRNMDPQLPGRRTYHELTLL